MSGDWFDIIKSQIRLVWFKWFSINFNWIIAVTVFFNHIWLEIVKICAILIHTFFIAIIDINCKVMNKLYIIFSSSFQESLLLIHDVIDILDEFPLKVIKFIAKFVTCILEFHHNFLLLILTKVIEIHKAAIVSCTLSSERILSAIPTRAYKTVIKAISIAKFFCSNSHSSFKCFSQRSNDILNFNSDSGLHVILCFLKSLPFIWRHIFHLSFHPMIVLSQFLFNWVCINLDSDAMHCSK